MATEFYCGYCGGDVIWSEANAQYEHADDGQRVDSGVPGDYVSGAHNRKGTRVGAYDVERTDERDADDEAIYHESLNDVNVDGCLTDPDGLAGPITDSAGYLYCGCHGSQREHTCQERDVKEFNPASEI